MIYREYLVMRKALAWFVVVLFAIVAIGFISGTIRIDPRGRSFNDVGDICAWLAAIFASIFRVALGNASREPARVLWVLPTARWKIALQLIVVDLGGATLAFAFACAVMLLPLLAGAHFKYETLGAASIPRIVAALTLIYATYGWSALIGMLGRRMAYSGIIALPALMMWMVMAETQGAATAILRKLVAANPFAVYVAWLNLNSWVNHKFQLDPASASLQWLGSTWEAPLLLTIAVVTCGVAVILWQRAEVLM